MPLGKKWRSLDFFGSLENLHLPSYHLHSHHHSKRDKDKHGKDRHGKDKDKDRERRKHTDVDRQHSERAFCTEERSWSPFRPRLSSLSSVSEQRGSGGTEGRRDGDTSDGPPTSWSSAGLVQRCVIIQKDERGYGLTVSGDNPVYVASVKPEGAAAKAGVQKNDRIVKVNGTLVTSKNHTDVVRLIKSGAYVALTLMGKPNSATSPGGNQPPPSPSPSFTDPSNAPSKRNSQITAPQPVAPDKDRELLLQKVHMTQAMYEQAREDFQKHQRQYVKSPSERLHIQLLEKERTVKTLENQLRQLTGSDDPTTPSATQGSQRFSDLDQISNTDLSSLNSWASSLPVSDLGSMSDSPHTSPSISPTPIHPDNRTDDSNSLSSRTDSAIEDCTATQSDQIITIDDEDVNSDDDQLLGVRSSWSGNRSVSPYLTRPPTAEQVDTGPFSDIRLLEKKPAHMAVFLHYLISNSDPSPCFFYIVSDAFRQTAGSTKDLRKWGYEIFSTFLAPSGPLRVEVSESLVAQVNDILVASATRTDNETLLRGMFDGVRAALSSELAEQLADFRSKRDLGLGSFYGVHELKENMDRGSELKAIDKYLSPHLNNCILEEGNSGKLSDRDQALGWALATFFRQVGLTKPPSSGAVMERVQSFIMKDKRGFKIPGSRSAKSKTVKNHQFNLQHFYVPTMCAKCDSLIWGVGYQGFLCQSCDMGVHKQCVEDVVETCTSKKRGKRASAFIPVLSTSRKTSNPNSQAGERSYSVSEALSQALGGEARSPPPYPVAENPGVGLTQPLRKDDESELAGLPTEHSVKSIVNRYHELTYPTGPGPGEGEDPASQNRKASIDLNRSESLKGKGDKTERPARRAKSDVDRDDMFRALNQQSGSSSASSLSNRSMESPSTSSEHVNDALTSARVAQYDSDLEVDDLPSLKQVLGDDVLKKLKPKEKKRQEVVNELFHTERAHLRNLKVLQILFYGPMVGIMPDLARALFPNIDEVIHLHASMNKAMKDRRSQNPVVGDVGDILLERFDGEKGDEFRKACAEYCRNQSFALEALKRQRRKDQRLSQTLAEAEADKLCRKLELKDHVPCQMQRLTKYPLLIENLLRHSQNNSQEYKNLERALERSKHILAYVNTAVRECENYHKLKEMQKKLDKRAIDAYADDLQMEIKGLDLTTHKLVYDGSLVWRLRSHRQIDLHVLLLEDILVLLQRVDERLVLKCQSTNQQSSGNDYKYTHSPVLKLQNLLARNVATDKKAFFVINTSSTGPQIYELVAQTQDARKTWCKLINEKAEEQKKSLGSIKKIMPAPKTSPSPERREIEVVRRQILEKSQEPSPPPATPSEQGQDTPDGIFSSAVPDYQPELIQPDQVDVVQSVTVQAHPVLSPRVSAQLQQHQAKGAAGQTMPVPMDQLRGMANEMNSILSNLLSVMETKGEERKSLRTELQAAQDQLEMLKAIQRQMMSQQSPSPSTPQSRPLSFASVASSISEGGETTDSDRQEEDGGGLLKVAQTQEMTDTAEETVQQLLTSVQPQVATTTSPSPTTSQPEDDSDDACEMIPDNLPLPDDNSVRADEPFASTLTSERRRSFESEQPMMTDLDDGGGVGGGGGEEEGGRTTPTPSLASTMTVGDDEEREEDRDSITTLCDSQLQSTAGARPGGVGEEGGSVPKREENDNVVDNNNSTGDGGDSSDSQLTSPIEI